MSVHIQKGFDTGLREADGAARPVFDTFVGLRGFAPRGCELPAMDVAERSGRGCPGDGY